MIDPETGEITGYKTGVGADTVFPFSGGRNNIFEAFPEDADNLAGQSRTFSAPTGNFLLMLSGYYVATQNNDTTVTNGKLIYSGDILVNYIQNTTGKIAHELWMVNTSSGTDITVQNVLRTHFNSILMPVSSEPNIVRVFEDTDSLAGQSRTFSAPSSDFYLVVHGYYAINQAPSTIVTNGKKVYYTLTPVIVEKVSGSVVTEVYHVSNVSAGATVTVSTAKRSKLMGYTLSPIMRLSELR